MAASRLLRAAPRNYAVLDLAAGELFESTCRQLLLTACRPVARKLVDHSRKLRSDENAELLVGRVLRDVVRNENLHF